MFLSAFYKSFSVFGKIISGQKKEPPGDQPDGWFRRTAFIVPIRQ